jgi:hypothetical protein
MAAIANNMEEMKTEEEVLAAMAEAVKKRMEQQGLSRYAVRRKMGVEHKKRGNSTPVDNVLEGQGYNIRTLYHFSVRINPMMLIRFVSSVSRVSVDG